MINQITDLVKAIIAKLKAYWGGLSADEKKVIQEKVWNFVKEHFVNKWEAHQTNKAKSDTKGATA
jgi:dsRNA-specific ribonuclease